MKNHKRILSLVLAMALICAMCLSGCGGKEKTYEGMYTGSAGSVLELRTDGVCFYTDNGWNAAKEGTWAIENDVLTVSGVLKYDIYARLSDANDASLLFEADTSRWNAEVFTKVN